MYLYVNTILNKNIIIILTFLTYFKLDIAAVTKYLNTLKSSCDTPRAPSTMNSAPASVSVSLSTCVRAVSALLHQGIPTLLWLPLHPSSVHVTTWEPTAASLCSHVW